MLMSTRAVLCSCPSGGVPVVLRSNSASKAVCYTPRRHADSDLVMGVPAGGGGVRLRRERSRRRQKWRPWWWRYRGVGGSGGSAVFDCEALEPVNCPEAPPATIDATRPAQVRLAPMRRPRSNFGWCSKRPTFQISRMTRERFGSTGSSRARQTHRAGSVDDSNEVRGGGREMRAVDCAKRVTNVSLARVVGQYGNRRGTFRAGVHVLNHFLD